MHTCPMATPGLPPIPHVGGPILPPGCPTVLIGMMPAARMGDQALCVGPPDVIAKGSPTVMIGYMQAARIGDPTVHGGVIVVGLPTVIIGETGMGSPSSSAPAVPQAAGGNVAPGPLQPSTEGSYVSGPGGGGKSGAAAGSGAGAQGASSPPPPAVPPEKTWIGVQLTDFTGAPIPNEKFRMVLDGGQVLSGTTDDKGYKRFEGVDPDSGNVHFLDIPHKGEFAGRGKSADDPSPSPVSVAKQDAPTYEPGPELGESDLAPPLVDEDDSDVG